MNRFQFSSAYESQTSKVQALSRQKRGFGSIHKIFFNEDDQTEMNADGSAAKRVQNSRVKKK